MTEKTQISSQTKKQLQTNQTKNNKTTKKDSAVTFVTKNIYDRFKDDWVVRGPLVTIVKWTVLLLLASYIVAGLIDYVFPEKQFQDFVKLQLTRIWFVLQIFLFSYIVYHDYTKAFLKANATLFDKYRSLLFWFSFVSLFIMVYNFVYPNMN